MWKTQVQKHNTLASPEVQNSGQNCEIKLVQNSGPKNIKNRQTNIPVQLYSANRRLAQTKLYSSIWIVISFNGYD